MAININKLLLKKGWKGAEVGRLLMASMLHDIKHYQEPDYKPLFTQAQYERMASNLSTQRDYMVLDVYSTLYDSVSTLYNKAGMLMQQAWHGYYRYIMHISSTMWAEQEQRQMTLTATEEWQPVLADYTLAHLCTDDDYMVFIKSELAGCVNLMRHAYSYIYAYNLVIEMLGELYDIDGIEALQSNGIDTIAERAEAVNALIAQLFENTSGTPAEVKKKRKKLEGFLQPIECSAWQPSPDAIEAVKESLKELGLSREAIAALAQRPLDATISKLAEGR